MSLDLAAFRVSFPELASAEDATVTAKLAEALKRVDSDVWGDLVDDGQGYLAAHLVCLSPAGIQAKLADKTGRSVYLSEFERLCSIVSSGYRVTGDVV